MANFTGRLNPGETNFVISTPLTKAEADALYFPINGDLGSASFGITQSQMESAITAAIEPYLTEPELDARYLTYDADLTPLLEGYQSAFEGMLSQQQIQLESQMAFIATDLDSLLNVHRSENPAHSWEQISNKPDTATRWPDWTEVTSIPDLDSLYRSISSPITWTEITGKPDLYPPATHTHDWSQITGVPPTGGGTSEVTYNIVRSSPAFVEEFDDFLSLNSLNKLGWSTANNNGWSGSEAGNRFPFAKGVFAVGINGANQSTANYSTLRLGNFPIIPQSSEGYLNIEISAVVGLQNSVPTQIDWASRFGLLDVAAGDGTSFGILVSAEYFNGGYNWVAIWKFQSGVANKQVICPVAGNLATKLFELKIKVNCETFAIDFTADGVTTSVLIGQSKWLFGAMSPIFVIQREAVTGTNSRTFWVDRYLFRQNVTDVEIPTEPSEVDWVDVLNKPDFDSLYRQLSVPIDWSEIANAPTGSGSTTNWASITDKPSLFPPDAHNHPWDEVTNKPSLFPPSSHSHAWNEITSAPAMATRWPAWFEVTDKPTLFPPSSHTHTWANITDPPATSTRWPTWSEVTGKPTTFTPSSHTHDWSQVTNKPPFSADWPAITNKPIDVTENILNPSLTLQELTIFESNGNTRGWIKWYHDPDGLNLNLEASAPRYYGIDTGVFFKWEITTNSEGTLVHGKVPYTQTIDVAKATEAAQSYSFGPGWAQYGGTYACSYRRLDKMVSLSGLVARTATSGTLIATLPVGYRPPSTKVCGCRSSQGYTGVDVNASGQILLASPNPATAIAWISLDQISFFVA